jgi:hypothetical protein
MVIHPGEKENDMESRKQKLRNTVEIRGKNYDCTTRYMRFVRAPFIDVEVVLPLPNFAPFEGGEGKTSHIPERCTKYTFPFTGKALCFSIIGKLDFLFDRGENMVVSSA